MQRDEPETPPDAAVILTVPPVAETPVARPCEPEVLLMLAMVGSEEFQVTRLVTSSVSPSSYVPCAVS